MITVFVYFMNSDTNKQIDNNIRLANKREIQSLVKDIFVIDMLFIIQNILNNPTEFLIHNIIDNFLYNI